MLLAGGQRVLRWWLTLVARRKSEELFILNILLVTLGLAWLTELAGCRWLWAPSWAGMLIAETEYKHQVEMDIAFHDVLLGLFFITIGMQLTGTWWSTSGGWCCCSPCARGLQGWADRRPWPAFGGSSGVPSAPACTWRRPAIRPGAASLTGDSGLVPWPCSRPSRPAC